MRSSEGKRVSRDRIRTEETLRALVLRHRSEVFFAADLQICFHQNTCTMASLSRNGRRLNLRLHDVFTKASACVLEAVVRSFFAPRGRKQIQRFRERIFDFLEGHQLSTVRKLTSRHLRAPKGEVYNLRHVQETIRKRFLPQCPRLKIGWSPRVTPTLMGKWIATPEGSPNVIVVNPLLDNSQVPSYYVQYIVFHELLHEIIPIRRRKGRWVHHPVEFRRKERQFPHFERAVRWERDNVVRLFRAYLKQTGTASTAR